MNTISNINLNGIISKLKDHAEQFRGTDLEKKVKEATSNANWGVTFQIKEDIARSTYDYQAYNQVMNIIWKRMGESGKNWKMVFKSLDLLEYLLKRGSERVIAEAQGRQYQIRTLRDFHFSESDGRDKGGGIREKSRAICELLNDKTTLDTERAKARAQVGKYMGISHYDSFGSSFNAHRTSAQYDPDYTFRDQGKPDPDNADHASGSKKKKKKKKKAPKPEDDLSDDVLSPSDDESQRPSRVDYHIPEPPGPDKAQSKRKKKKDRSKRRSEDAKATESSLIPDFFATDSFSNSNLSPQPAQNLAPSDPLSVFDFSTTATRQTSQPYDAFFSGSQQPAAVQSPPAAGPFQDVFQTPPPPARLSSSAFQQPPSLFSPEPVFFQSPEQQSMLSQAASPAQNAMFASPGAVYFPSPSQAAQGAGESDNDDWGFISAANSSTPRPQAQIDFFGTPTKPADARTDSIWNDFSTLSISSPPQRQPRTQAPRSPQVESVFTGFDIPSSLPPANKQDDLGSFF